jgi:energy-coupling factor transporter ATP-binding protein EcfA2
VRFAHIALTDQYSHEQRRRRAWPKGQKAPRRLHATRPLIIDQPEENLDPKSIFDELVSLFREAKNKRQVIMVTHNANLVVNTDADQIIVAQVGPHPPGELPPITYLSGGLESAQIRKAVCDILEGGERALQERARRLRVRLERSASRFRCAFVEMDCF